MTTIELGGLRAARFRLEGGVALAGLLALGAACAAFSVGNHLVPVAAWLAPLFLLRFARIAPARWLWLGAAALALANMLAWRGVVPLYGAVYFAATAGLALVQFLPLLADRWLARRLTGLSRSLVFPAGWTAAELAFSRLGLGTWSLIGYSQSGELPLLQILALFGLGGLTFLIGWGASAANALWDREPAAPRVALIFALALALALAGGGLRLALARPGVETVRIAGLTIDNLEVFKDTWGPLSYGRPLTEAQAQAVAGKTAALQAALLERSRREARAGARIIVWSEANALVLRADEEAFIAEGRALAAEEGVHLFMAMAVMTPGEPLARNKLVVVDPSGEVRGTYLKSHPTPGEASVPGDGRMGWIDTPHGRIAWAICYDFDYPELIRQAGRARADILIDPSWETLGMTPLHSQMAAFRAVENGAALFRPVNGGLGLAVDAYGRTLASLDHYASADAQKVLLADVPTRGARTLYPWIGDAPALASALLLLVLAARRLLAR